MESTPDTPLKVEDYYNEATPSKEETSQVQVPFQLKLKPEKQKRGPIATVFWKLFLILYKNLILRKRQYIVTAFEIILPTLLVFFLVMGMISVKKAETETHGGRSENRDRSSNVRMNSMYSKVSEQVCHFS
jgi:hypothetical protein